MIIAVAGGTGVLGRHIVRELRSRNHAVRVLSRHSSDHRIDLTTGEGLSSALKGCDIVIDASNASTKAAETLVEGTRRLLAAGKKAGIGHHVCVSVAGCDKIPMGYFQTKADQERLVEHGEVPWTIVRATQFHEYMAAMFEQAARWKMMPIPRFPVQTVAAAEVARIVADAALSPPLHSRLEIAGPEIADARELARIWRSATNRRAVFVPMALPGKTGKALRSGAATLDQPDFKGTITFAAWLNQAMTPSNSLKR